MFDNFCGVFLTTHCHFFCRPRAAVLLCVIPVLRYVGATAPKLVESVLGLKTGTDQEGLHLTTIRFPIVMCLDLDSRQNLNKASYL